MTIDDMNGGSSTISALTKDSSQNWKTTSWSDESNECVKIDTAGCDVLTAKIKRSWNDYVESEDLSLSGNTYSFSLATSHDGSTETYDAKSLTFANALSAVQTFTTSFSVFAATVYMMTF